MSAYYLKQVVKAWSLATIYKGMLEFMILQIIAITLIIVFPQIATWFPEYLAAEARKVPVERVIDDAPSLEADSLYAPQPDSATQEGDPLEQGAPKEEGDPLEKGDDKPK
jgi:hypothetical protein